VVKVTLEDDQVGLGEVLEKIGRFGVEVPLESSASSCHGSIGHAKV